MKHEIIKDGTKLKDFVCWLPDLKPTEKFYVALFARKKYDDSLQTTSSDKTQLKRFLCTKKDLITKLKQLEIDQGGYLLKDRVATQKSLAVYITPNPRCMIKANKSMLIKLAKAVSDQNFFHNLHQEALSCVQGSKSYAHVVDFDIDDKTIDLTPMQEILHKDCYKILETRGGYHIMVYPKLATEYNRMLNFGTDEYPYNWHEAITSTFPCDITGDQMIPIPGCTQGEFTPKFLK